MTAPKDTWRDHPYRTPDKPSIREIMVPYQNVPIEVFDRLTRYHDNLGRAFWLLSDRGFKLRILDETRQYIFYITVSSETMHRTITKKVIIDYDPIKKHAWGLDISSDK